MCGLIARLSVPGPLLADQRGLLRCAAVHAQHPGRWYPWGWPPYREWRAGTEQLAAGEARQYLDSAQRACRQRGRGTPHGEDRRGTPKGGPPTLAVGCAISLAGPCPYFWR